ncbi:MAG: carbon-nitrogen hydrolase family protein [Thaumarchaeota archaeon]|nr:carbon-nitrogen hydrolase family protein [Nitrososphaerota archaeon]
MKEEVAVRINQFDVKSVVDEEKAREDNISYICDSISRAKENELLVFPELSISGYIREFNPAFRARFWEKGSDDYPYGDIFSSISDATKKTCSYAVVGFCEKSGIKYECFDSVVLIGPGGIIGRSRKTHLPINEKHYFIPGEVGSVFSTPLGKIGMMICYDMSFPETARILALRGAEIIICIADWGDSHNQLIQWQVLPTTRAIENQVHFIACNRVGGWNIGPSRGNVRFFGRSKIVSAFGEVLAEANDSQCSVTANLTSSDLRRGAQFISVFRDRMPSVYGDILSYVSEKS